MKKRILSFLLTVVIAIGMFSSVASAANTSDTSFSYYVYTNGPTGCTQFRTKENYTYPYVRVTEITYGTYIRLNLEGEVQNSTGGYDTEDITLGGRVNNLIMGRWRVRYKTGLGDEIASMNVRLRFTRHSDDTAVVGVWSPDCAGTYNYIN